MPFEGRFVASGDRSGEGGLGAAEQGLLESRTEERRKGGESLLRGETGSGQRVPRSGDETGQAVGPDRCRQVVESAVPGPDDHGVASEGLSQPPRRSEARPGAVDCEGRPLELPGVGGRPRERLKGVAGAGRQPGLFERGEDLGPEGSGVVERNRPGREPRRRFGKGGDETPEGVVADREKENHLRAGLSGCRRDLQRPGRGVPAGQEDRHSPGELESRREGPAETALPDDDRAWRGGADCYHHRVTSGQARVARSGAGLRGSIRAHVSAGGGD